MFMAFSSEATFDANSTRVETRAKNESVLSFEKKLRLEVPWAEQRTLAQPIRKQTRNLSFSAVPSRELTRFSKMKKYAEITAEIYILQTF